jgi:EAL domain-containing protein (putative c-di-GMP-specific phosphodiesterase class I)
MLTLLDIILEPGSLVPLFQPIFKVAGKQKSLHSLECLMRGPKGTSVERANVLFAYVRLKRSEIAVDRACMRAALTEAARLPGEPNISVNVHASTLGRDTGFAAYLKGLAESCGVSPSRVTVELIEHAPVWDAAGILRSIEQMRGFGMRLAVDDVGAGQSNYNMILDCCPDALKVDAYVVRGCHADRHRVAVLESIVTLAQKLEARIVAEGIEEQADLEVLQAMGIDLIQGYLLARPMSTQNLITSGILGNQCLPQLAQPVRAETSFSNAIARYQG